MDNVDLHKSFAPNDLESITSIDDVTNQQLLDQHSLSEQRTQRIGSTNRAPVKTSTRADSRQSIRRLGATNRAPRY